MPGRCISILVSDTVTWLQFCRETWPESSFLDKALANTYEHVSGQHRVTHHTSLGVLLEVSSEIKAYRLPRSRNTTEACRNQISGHFIRYWPFSQLSGR